MPIRRLYVICEGHTEAAFVNSVLVPHFGICDGLQTIPLLLPNKLKSRSRMHKGGWLNYAIGRSYVEHILKEMHSEDVWVTTMLDLYAIPNNFPGLPAARAKPPLECVTALETAFANDVKTDRLWRFTPYLQLHEYEALLLVDIDAIGRTMREYAATGVPALKGDIGALRPEEVDDGRSSAPSKRIIRHFPDYDGAKASAGPIIAADIGLDRLRVACPHFGRWLTTLETQIRRT